VAEERQRRTERLEDVDLPRCVVDVLVTAEHVADGHIPVVDDDAEVVSRHAQAVLGAFRRWPHDDQVIDLAVVDRDAALDEIVPAHVAVGRVAKAHHRQHVGWHRRQHLSGLGAPAAVVAGLLAASALCLAHHVEFGRRAVAAVGGAGFEHLRDHDAVAIEALHLVDRALVVVEPEPVHRREDLVDRVLRRARHIGVFDAQHELAAMVARVSPREQRGAGGAEVQKAGGRRRDAGSDFAGHEASVLRPRCRSALMSSMSSRPTATRIIPCVMPAAWR